MATLKSSYKIISEHNIIIEFHKGNIEVDSYIKFKEKTFNDEDFKTGLNYLIHFKNVTFFTPQEDIKKFVNFIKNNAPKLGKRKVALITNTPNQVVSTTIYKTMQANLNQEVEIFSTDEAALNWLIPKSFSFKDLNEILKILFAEIN